MIGSILIATDGSDTAKRAVERGARLAEQVGASVHVITAFDPLHGARVVGGGPETADWQLRPDSRADAVLEDACAAARVCGVEARPHARKGDPADAILDLADELEPDLIVVGNKGLSGGRRFLLGSVPNKVSHHAPCSVLIVHTAA